MLETIAVALDGTRDVKLLIKRVCATASGQLASRLHKQGDYHYSSSMIINCDDKLCLVPLQTWYYTNYLSCMWMSGGVVRYKHCMLHHASNHLFFVQNNSCI